MMLPVASVELRLSDLRARCQGEVIAPDDPHYNQARQAWNLAVDQHPAAVVIAANAADVAECVRFARLEGLDVTVQGTGHGVVHAATDNDLLIITSKMKQIRVDATAQTAWIEAGAKWGEVLAKTQTVGLAPLLGSSTDVGVVGYTLGGGFGWLGRKYGMASDAVRHFEVVTADGAELRASETENSDLFWALRGGGGSLGIVTAMEINLFPVTTVYGGNLFYPVIQAKEVFRRYREWIATVPDELTSSVALMNFPPIPEIPEPLRGQSFAIVRGCYCGTIEVGADLLRFWREWQAPVIDDFKPMPFSDVATISNDPVDPMPGLSTGAWLRELSDEAIATLISHVIPFNGPSPVALAEVRHAGGAVAKVNAQTSAYGNRDAYLLLQMVGVTPTPDAHARLSQHFASIKEQLQPDLTGGVYMNFLEGEESRQQVKAGFSSEAYERLATLKSRYDSNNRLRSGFQIQPYHLTKSMTASV